MLFNGGNASAHAATTPVQGITAHNIDPPSSVHSCLEEIHAAPSMEGSDSSSPETFSSDESAEMNAVEKTFAASSLRSQANSCAQSPSQGLQNCGSSTSLSSLGSDGAESGADMSISSGSPGKGRGNRLKGCRVGTCVMVGRCICSTGEDAVSTRILSDSIGEKRSS